MSNHSNMWLLLLDMTRAKWANKQWLLSLEISTQERRRRGEYSLWGGYFIPTSWLFCVWRTGEARWQWKVSMWLHTSDGMTERKRERKTERRIMEEEEKGRAVISRSRPFGRSVRLTSCQLGRLILGGTERRQAELSLSPTICLSLLLFAVLECKNRIWWISRGCWSANVNTSYSLFLDVCSSTWAGGAYESQGVRRGEKRREVFELLFWSFTGIKDDLSQTNALWLVGVILLWFSIYGQI